MKIITHIQKLGFLKEIHLFIAVIILSCLPVLQHNFFPTLDGPAHLYNANLILELLNGNETIHSFFSLNTSPNPNLTGHIILSTLLLVFPAFVAEKILLLFYIIGFAYYFRKLILTLNPQGAWLSYLSFPLIYSFVFTLGFYNFSLGLVFLLLTVYYWTQRENSKLSKLEVFWLFCLLIITFFSHVFVFGVLILILGTRQLLSIFEQKKTHTVSGLRKALEFSIASLPAIILFFYYFLSRPSAHSSVYQSTETLIYDLVSIRPLVAYSTSFETPFLVIFGICIVVLGGYILTQLKWKFSLWKSNLLNNSWILLSVMLFVLYFILPDSNSLGGFINTRIALVFYLLFVIWIGVHQLPLKVVIPCVLLILFSHFKLVTYYSHAIKDLNKIAVNCSEMESYIDANSVVIPLNYSENWITGHFSNYLGITKPLVILDNYEAVNNYFPLVWDWDFVGNELYENMSSNNFQCITQKKYLNQPHLGSVYLFVLGDIKSDTNSCAINILQEIKRNFEPVAKNEHCSLFKLVGS